eukprot:TRINITY_DN4175_c0_g1_i1.p1 TRINITY_DN4175_c0_g1~~TRINITY_DN4175_c0_g1_i1.p1  ORF type:complete len:1095 (-),score=408.45 TRINITY_DN4175_c0_g1_i1:485-3769(-)
MTSVAFPVEEVDEEEKLRRKDKYNLKQYRGLADSIQGIKDQVERERRLALETEQNLRRTLHDTETEAKTVHKELSTQLRVANRSYEQLLGTIRELTDMVRAEEEKRVAEVEPLKVEIKLLKSKLGVIEKPWKDEVAKRDLKILRLQESIPPLEQKIREERMKLPPVIAKFKEEVRVREEATECVLKEVQYWKDEVAEKEARAAEVLQKEKDRAAAEIAPVREELEKVKAELAVATDPYVKEIRELKKTIELKEFELSKVDYSPYEKMIDIKDVAYKKLVRDFEVKQAYNKENHDKMRESFEQVIVRMDKKLQDLMRHQDKLVAPYVETIEERDAEIERLHGKMDLFKQEAAESIQRELDIQTDLRKELKAAKEAVDLSYRELTRAKRQLQEQLDELEGDGGPWKRMRRLEAKLEDVTERCEALVRVKDREIEEKTNIIRNLQLGAKQKLNELAEIDRTWNKRIQKKEEGYQRITAELAFAEGQILEERKRTAAKVKEVKQRELDIIRLKEEHTEELRIRMLDREELERFIRELENSRLSETESYEQEIQRLEEEVVFFRRRADADVADMMTEVQRRDKARKLVEEELAQIRQEYDKARISWEDKERELELVIRTRDRHITSLKNEIEFINDSWEIKYNNLLAIFEKMQRKYDEVVGPNGMNELQRRNRDLKEEIIHLNNIIQDMKEQLKKQKRRIRDLEIEIDGVLKETADIICEKERGMAEMVGDYHKLQNRYREQTELMEKLLKEKDTEMVTTAESFQVRIDQLEQLVESMRFTDRQELVDRIETWKKSYERVCLQRDDIEEELQEIIDIKEGQVLKMAEENNRFKDEALQEAMRYEDEMEKKDATWRQKEIVWRTDAEDLKAKIRDLEMLIEELKARAQKGSLMVDTKADDEEKEELRRIIAQKEEDIKQVEMGVAALVEENRQVTAEVENVGVDIDAIHASYVPKLAEKDKMIKRMQREYDELKEVLELEMFRAQEACRAIEERVRKFPNPFEYECREMRDKYAQMQAGMVKMNLENIKLREDFINVKEAKEEEIKDLEKQLKTAAGLLKDIAQIGVLQSMSPQEIQGLEDVLGVDLDGNGQVGSRGRAR